MALSKNTYTADGSTTNFNITWSYMNTSEVKVKLDGVASTAFTFSGTSVIVMNSAPSNGTIVSIYRETNRSTRAVDFEDATTLTEANLDDANTQNFYVIQELLDDQTENLSQDFDGVWDANSKRIKNVSDPTSAQDSSTKNYVDTRTIPATQIGDGTVSNDEFQRLDGVTSDIQTQLDAKAPSTNIDSANIANGTVSNAEFQRLNGVTSDIQTQLDGKAPSTIDAVNIGDGSVSNAEFQRLDGVTSDIQTQLDAKAPSTGIDATKIADGTISNTEFQYLNGATSNLQAQFDSMVDPGFAVDETDTNTAKNKFVSNNLAKGWTDTKTAFDAQDISVHTDPLTMDEESTPSNPASNKHKLYFKSDGTLYKLNSSGTEAQVGGDTDSVVTNASDIFTTNVRLLEQHGTQSAIMEKGFTDELSASNDMIDESASSGYTYNATDDYYKNTDGATGVNDDKDYTVENNYIQQEWTNSNQSTSQATVTNGSATVTISSGTWPTNCANARITFDSGSTWYDISSRDSSTQITLNSNASESTTTYNWIIRMSGFSSGSVQLNEISSGYGTDETSPSSTVSGSGNVSGYTPASAVDNNDGYYGFCSNTTTGWWKVDFGSGVTKTISKYRIYGRNNGGVITLSNTMKDFQLQGSNNDSDWTTVDSVVGKTSWLNMAWEDFDSFSGTPAAYRYYRINITANNGGSYAGFGQIELMQSLTANPISEYVSASDTYTQSTDVSAWSDINSSAVTETLNSQNAYYWYSFDPASSYGAGTEIVVPKPAIHTNGITSSTTNGTILAMHMDGSNGSTTYTDSSANGFTITQSGSTGSLNTSTKKFGTASYYNTTSSDTSDGLITADSTQFDLSTTDFTIEFWMNLTGTNNTDVPLAVGNRVGIYNNNLHFQIDGSGSTRPLSTMLYTNATASSDINGTSYTKNWGTIITNNTWHNIILTRSGTVLTLYLNGVSKGTRTVPADFQWTSNSTSNFACRIGNRMEPINPSYRQFCHGYIDEIKIDRKNWYPNGVDAVQTSAFGAASSTSPYIRPIAKNDSGTWKYNSNASANNTWTAATATTNDMLHATSQAISSQAENRLTSSEISSLADADFELTNGFTTSDSKLTRGLTLYSGSSSQNPEVSQFRVNYDADASAISLVSKQWDGSTGRPSAPSTAPETMYLFVVDEQTSGTPSYFVSRDGTTWTAVTFDASWVFSGTKMARRASIDMSATNTGTNPKFKVTCPQGSVYKIHAVGLQTRG